MQQRPPFPAPPALASLMQDAPVALFLDFDGTLVDIAPTHDAIDVPPQLSSALLDLSAHVEGRLAIVTGRSIADLQDHLGSPQIGLAGSHGIEIRTAQGEVLTNSEFAPDQQLLSEIEAITKTLPGVTIEKKVHGLAIHYRAREEYHEQVHAHSSGIADRFGLVVKPGKCVVELVAGDANKGSAVDVFMATAQFEGATPIFVGDDLTDEDGFAQCAVHGGFGILVGEMRDTAARYRLTDTAAVYRWLQMEMQ